MRRRSVLGGFVEDYTIDSDLPDLYGPDVMYAVYVGKSGYVYHPSSGVCPVPSPVQLDRSKLLFLLEQNPDVYRSYRQGVRFVKLDSPPDWPGCKRAPTYNTWDGGFTGETYSLHDLWISKR